MIRKFIILIENKKIELSIYYIIVSKLLRYFLKKEFFKYNIFENMKFSTILLQMIMKKTRISIISPEYEHRLKDYYNYFLFIDIFLFFSFSIQKNNLVNKIYLIK